MQGIQDRRGAVSGRRYTMSRKRLPIFPRTDAGNAELFAARYGDRVCYDHRQGRWLIWDTSGRRWAQDTEEKICVLAIAAARSRFRSALNIAGEDERKREANWAIKSEYRYRLEASIEIAKALSPISDSGTNWDCDPWLLGVANGIVDLRTGKVRTEQTVDRITKHSPVQFNPDATCPRFEEFLSEIFREDKQLIGYIQRAVGYSLTGSISEQCLFCCHGSGANGKSTLFGVLHYIFGLGEYAANLPFSALEFQNRNSNDLVLLVGARFVTAAETREGARLNEQRIKSLTGGDLITARRLYHDPFTFSPTHKLWLAFNHKPIIADASEGMWRRVRLIPFTRQFKPNEQDKSLVDTLRTESPGILAWAGKGCLDWQKDGLGMPSAVAEAHAVYRPESDHLGQFIDECCVIDTGTQVPVTEMWRMYLQWVAENEEVPLARQSFGERLEKKGFSKGRSGHQGTRVWKGIALCADMLTSADKDSNKDPVAGTISENL